MKVIISNRGLTELRISPEGKLVLVSPTGDVSTNYVWEEIKVLDCYNNQLKTLPWLPKGLKELYCYNNPLETLPPLPEGLKWLHCSNNPLKSLPPLPEGLVWLDCDNNQLKTLPSLPEGLVVLYCSNNPFSKGVCRDQVPFELRGKVPEHAYNLYDEILTLCKEKFRKVLGGLMAKPS